MLATSFNMESSENLNRETRNYMGCLKPWFKSDPKKIVLVTLLDVKFEPFFPMTAPCNFDMSGQKSGKNGSNFTSKSVTRTIFFGSDLNHGFRHPI
jgi:hypothetical protein